MESIPLLAKNMFMYTASQELIDILLKNGLRDKSYLYRNCLEGLDNRYALKGIPYTASQKKSFGIGKSQSHLEFYFDYMNFSIIERNLNISEEYTKINEDQLRSILTYFQLSYQRRKTLREYCGNRIETAGKLMREERAFGIIQSPFDKIFERTFESIII